MDDLIKNQATLNIGTIGHVAHGKSTLVRSISGKSTIKYKSELERNITIKLGYANAKIYECTDESCPRPDRYKSAGSKGPDTLKCPRKGCKGTMKLVRHISFVDCPGHDVLMATMLTGTAIMDSAILLVAANESCPQPQTQEHLFAVEVMDLKKIVVVQNKIDLVSKEQAVEQKEAINEFLRSTKVSEAPVVPASSQIGLNIDAVLDFIVNYIPLPHKRLKESPRMVIIRSFDVNRPGCKISNLKGGVMGGSLLCGKIGIGDEIEIRPGLVTKIRDSITCRPYITKIVSLKTEENTLDFAVPGGLIGVGTNLDPMYCKGDKLVGMVMGLKGDMPDIYIEIEVEFTLFETINVAARQKGCPVSPIKKGESYLLNIGSTTTGSFVTEEENGKAVFELKKPACCNLEERIAISRKINNHWRLIGYGKVKKGKKVEIAY